MNNKGQTLVIFIIILPILLLIFTFIIDLGVLHLEKRNINNNVYDAINYYLNNVEKKDIEDEVKALLYKNIKNIDKINIENNEKYIKIIIEKNIKSVYSFFSNNTKINVSYTGIKESKKIIKG